MKRFRIWIRNHFSKSILKFKINCSLGPFSVTEWGKSSGLKNLKPHFSQYLQTIFLAIFFFTIYTSWACGDSERGRARAAAGARWLSWAVHISTDADKNFFRKFWALHIYVIWALWIYSLRKQVLSSKIRIWLCKFKKWFHDGNQIENSKEHLL